jgi:hypothetical protein
METIGPLRSRESQIASHVYWGTTIIDYDGSGNILYYSTHHLHNADEGLLDWVIKKFTTGSDGVTKIERLTGSYTGRAALDWA